MHCCLRQNRTHLLRSVGGLFKSAKLTFVSETDCWRDGSLYPLAGRRRAPRWIMPELHRRLCLHHLPDEDFVTRVRGGVTNRREIKLCHQILTSNYARTDQLHGGGRFARETSATKMRTSEHAVLVAGDDKICVLSCRAFIPSVTPAAEPQATPAHGLDLVRYFRPTLRFFDSDRARRHRWPVSPTRSAKWKTPIRTTVRWRGLERLDRAGSWPLRSSQRARSGEWV